MPRDREGDEELLARFVAGDEECFTALVQRHEDRIFALALRMTGDRADALDATQDTFVTAYRRASSFRGDAAFGTWLFRIGVNACRDLMRKRTRAPTPTEEAGMGIAARDTAVDEAVALRMDLAAALAAIPEEYREAVVMHDMGGVPYEEIARLTGTAVGTVKSHISRGRRKLADLLEPRPPRAASNKSDPGETLRGGVPR